MPKSVYVAPNGDLDSLLAATVISTTIGNEVTVGVLGDIGLRQAIVAAGFAASTPFVFSRSRWTPIRTSASVASVP